MTNQHYSTAQKLAFGGLTIGFLLCAVGCIAPYWQTGKINANKIADVFGVGDLIPVQTPNLATMHGGLWWYCNDVMLIGKGCEAYALDENKAADWIIRGLAVLNVFLAMLCTLAALCRSCCCQGGKTVCHGVMAFFAGAAGLTVIGIFASSTNDGFIMTLEDVEYGWSFFIYAAGSAVITVVSFILCFASPMNPFTGIIVSGVSQIMPNGYSRMTSDHPMHQPSEVGFSPAATDRY